MIERNAESSKGGFVAQQQSGGSYVVQFRYGGELYISVDGSCIVSESHIIFVLFSTIVVQLRACDCKKCALSSESGYKTLDMLELERLILGIHPTGVVVLESDAEMWLPLSDGRVTLAYEAMNRLGQAFASNGLTVQMDRPLVAARFVPGQWVRFIDDVFWNSDAIAVQGMLARVIPDPYGIAIAGKSVLLEVLGQRGSFDYFFEALEEVKSPSAKEITEATLLGQKAALEYQRKHGWMGVPAIGVPQAKVLREMKSIASRFARLSDREVDGSRKRVARLLDLFAPSPLGKWAGELAARCRDNSLNASAIEELSQDLFDWVTAAEDLS
jgi:hypothetical protein